MNNELVGIQIAIAFLFLIGFILVYVFYLLNLQRTLQEVKPENRKVAATNVWLLFIPIFNLIYPFILYPNIADSLKNEFEARGIQKEGDYGRGIGLALAICGVCGVIPVIGGLAGLGNLVLLIIFWVKMSNFKTELQKTKGLNTTGMNSSADILY
jgi:hypothetical protein